jgi:hypothetical protein
MSSTRNLARRAVRLACERLERLREALLGLGRRLRDSIAQLVGSHVGEAVRETVHALLEDSYPRPAGPDPPPRASYRGSYQQVPYRGESYPEDLYGDDSYHDDCHRHVGEEPYRRSQPDRHDHDKPIPQAVALPSPTWWSLVPPAVQMAGWVVRRLPGRPSLLGSLLVGVAAAVTTGTAGPMAGAVTAVAGVVVLLTALSQTIQR